MAGNGDFPLHESVPLDVHDQEPNDSVQNAPQIEQADSRQWESNRKRACVLLGTTILQLPIWGKDPAQMVVACAQSVTRGRSQFRDLLLTNTV